jgi:hypothetical protein
MMKLVPPKPEVQYLPAIFRRIQNGDIRVPAFQREFVWTEQQVLELLESVYRGFPIGSILFWHVDGQILKVASPESTVFPTLPEVYPLSYVLDGVQRLWTLYGCFHCKAIEQESIFNVIFNLDDEQFYHYRKGSLPTHYIHLSKIFSPKEFLEAQRSLSTDSNADSLLDISVKLYSTFQEYMVPTVTITDRAVDEVVDIFSRINSTGTRLENVDFLRAATWSEEFDLNNALDDISAAAKVEGFEIQDETIVKVFAICAHRNPTPQSMLELRSSNVADLLQAVDLAKQTLTQALRFLKTECLISSYEFVPYEGQLLILVKYAIEAGTSYQKHSNVMRQWFRSVSFNESYRGKPDSYVVRDIKQLEQFLRGDGPPLSSKLNVMPGDFVERVFTRGRALSAAVANLFAANGVRSLFTGEPIPVESFMSSFSPYNYSFLISLQDIQQSYPYSRTNRLLANIVVVTEQEYRQLKNTSLIKVLKKLTSERPDVAPLVLDSQMLSSADIEYIESTRFDKFLQFRAVEIYSKAIGVVGNQTHQVSAL